MKNFKKIMLPLVVVMFLTACGGNQNSSAGDNQQQLIKLTVGATPVPHAEILNYVKATMKEQGVELIVKEFTDYVQPNIQVSERQLDANFFQHMPYLEQFNEDKGLDLVKVAGVHIEPFGAYSHTLGALDELQDKAKVAIPNDPSNGGRALALLASQGLIELEEGVGVKGTVHDIVSNPKDLDIKELEAAMLPRVLDEVEMALINTNYALEADLVPMKDALFMENEQSPYVNILVSRPDNQKADAMQKLANALTSEDVNRYILEQYEGAVVPSFSIAP